MTLQAAHPGELTLGPEAPAPGGAPTPPAATPVPGLVRLPVGEVGRRPRRWSVALRLLLPVSVFAAWWILTATNVIPSDHLVDACRPPGTPSCSCGTTTTSWATSACPARRAALGLALGAGIGLILGIMVGLTRLGEELFDASMQMLRMVPYPAVIFLFIIWFGIGETAKVLLIGLATLFPMYLNTSNGVRNVDKRVVEAARSFGVHGWALVRRVVVPLAMPSIMTGLRFSAGISVIALVFTESIGANQGIGYLVSQADSLQQIPMLWWCASSFTRCSASGPTSWSASSSASACRGDGTRRSDEPLPPIGTDLAAVVHGVTKAFGARDVLADLDVTVAQGEFVALLGASGSGKTTLLRILAGLDTAGSGDVLVPEVRTVVFQEPRLVASQRVWRNVVLGLPRAQATRERAVSALQEVGLAPQADAWPGTLSGGEAQRVALARALVREPQLLLLDEPFAALDALTRLRMQQLVADLCARHRPGVLLVTHDVEEAVLLADRVMVLTEGRISLDQPVDLPRPRRVGGEEFDALRDRLLAELGVLAGAR